MAWSTRELAELAQTTVNTIRHYHSIGLLDEPERRYNGYKEYGVKDLVHLLRIRRLAGLGMPLSQIGNGDLDDQSTQEILRQLDAELVASIHRLQQVRSDILASLCDEASADAPTRFESIASPSTTPERSILHISGQLYDGEHAMPNLQYMVEVDANVGKNFDTLPPDANDAIRERLARLLTPILVRNLIRHPWLMKPTNHLSKSERVTRQTIAEAVATLYNPAQLDVIGRAARMAQGVLQADSEARHDAV